MLKKYAEALIASKEDNEKALAPARAEEQKALLGLTAKQLEIQVMGAKNDFPPRGGTLYVFSIDGVSPSSAPGLLTTQGAGAPAGHFNTPD